MKRSSTLFLQAVVVLVGAIILAACLFGLPRLIAAELYVGDFDYGYVFVGMYLPAIPFFVAVYQALKFLRYIEQNKAFSELSVRSLRIIKYCAVAISGLYAAGMPYIFYLADKDDAPGVAAIGFVIIFASLVIATAAGVFQRLLQHAVDIKSENDLTV